MATTTQPPPREAGLEDTEARGAEGFEEGAAGGESKGASAVAVSTIPSAPKDAVEAEEATGIRETKSDEENRGAPDQGPTASAKPPLQPATSPQQEQRRGRSRFRRLPPLKGRRHGIQSRGGLPPKSKGPIKGESMQESRDDEEKEEGRVLRAVATANEAVGGGGAGPVDPSSSRRGPPGSDGNPIINPIRLVQSLTSLARYRSSMTSLTFSPSEETIQCTVRHYVDNARLPPDNDRYHGDLLRAGIGSDGNNRNDGGSHDPHLYEAGSSNLGSFSSSSSSGVTNGASDSTLSSHFVVTTTLNDDDLQSDGVEVVACLDDAKYPATDDEAAYGVVKANGSTLAIVFTATTPRGGTIEVVGGPSEDEEGFSPLALDGAQPDGSLPISKSQTSVHVAEGLALCGAAVGAEDTAESLSHEDGSVAFGGCAVVNACAMAELPALAAAGEGAASELAAVQHQLPPNQLGPDCVRSGSVWSNPWSLFGPRETCAVEPNLQRGVYEADVAQAEERLVALVKDAATLDAIHEEAPIGPLSPYSSEPFTTGQSRVLASLYSRTTGAASRGTGTKAKAIPWEDPARLVRTSSDSSALNAMADCQSVALWVLPSVLASNKADDRSMAVPGRKGSNSGGDASTSSTGRALSSPIVEKVAKGRGGSEATGLFRMPRSVRSKRSSTDKHGTSSKLRKDSLTEIQELTSLESGSQFSLPRNLLQFDFILSSDLSSSYYGSSSATGTSKETANESGRSEDDSAMKRSSCESFDPSGSSSCSTSTRQSTIVPAKAGGAKFINQRKRSELPTGQAHDVPDENKKVELLREGDEAATGEGDASAQKGLKPNDSSHVEVVRYRVALGPIKFSYYARGRKKS
jgi:hypothetical protein